MFPKDAYGCDLLRMLWIKRKLSSGFIVCGCKSWTYCRLMLWNDGTSYTMRLRLSSSSLGKYHQIRGSNLLRLVLHRFQVRIQFIIYSVRIAQRYDKLVLLLLVLLRNSSHYLIQKVYPPLHMWEILFKWLLYYTSCGVCGSLPSTCQPHCGRCSRAVDGFGCRVAWPFHADSIWVVGGWLMVILSHRLGCLPWNLGLGLWLHRFDFDRLIISTWIDLY